MKMIRPLAALYEQLRHLPGIGSKTALRLSYHIVDLPTQQVEALAEALCAVKREVKLCQICCDYSDAEICPICSDEDRQRSVLCIVEQPQDVGAMERSRGYHGLYHVLHGVLSPLDGIGPKQLKLRELMLRLQQEEIREVIIATNADVEGEATATYIASLVKPLGITVTRIAHGLPVGGDLEYADEVTLSKALENRREL